MTTRASRVTAAVFVAVTALMGIGYYRLRPWTSDFLLYYRDARVGWIYGWSHLYDLARWDAITRQLGIHSLLPNSGPLSLPLLSWLVAPFALLPMPAAYAVWVTVLLALAGGGCWLLAPATGRENVRWGGIAALCLPLIFGLSLGSAIVIAFAAVAACWWLAREQRPFAAGLVLALILVRPQVAFLVPLCLLLAGRVRLFLGFVAGAGALGLATLLTIPIDSLSAYLHTMRDVAQHPSSWQVASEMTLSTLRPLPLAVVVSVAVIVAAGSVSWASRQRAHAHPIAITAGILGSLLVTPYLHMQDLTMLLAAAWLCARLLPLRWAPLLPMAVVAACNFELSIHTPLPAIVEVTWLVTLVVAFARVEATPAVSRAA